MRSARAVLSLLVLACLALVTDAKKVYKLKNNLKGQSLLNYFNFENKQADNGGVAFYNSYSSAKKKGLISVNKKSGAVTLRVSTKKKQSTRDSLRLVSKQTHSKGGLWIFDVAHIPASFGAWPSIWMTGYEWPAQGEIDIVEGVHRTTQNAMSVHTGPGCSMGTSGYSAKLMMTSGRKTDCNVYASDGQGCGVRSVDKKSYGPGANKVGGGVYALEWSSSGIKTYHWSRSKVPADIKKGKPSPSAKWGKPASYVRPSTCHPFNHFKNQQLVLVTNLCGTWASGTWHNDLSYAGSPGSPAQHTGVGSCEDFVRNNGDKLKDAYWTFNSIKIYQ